MPIPEPADRLSRGFSDPAGKREGVEWIKQHIDKDAKILDVGFGCGTYAYLLRDEGYQFIDGVDVYEKDIEELNLNKLYDNIYIDNILNFDFDYYDLIILGDVLEHLHLKDGMELLERWIHDGKAGNILVSIPYEFKQYGDGENPYERHLQDKVTPDYMKRYYPYLELLFTDRMEYTRKKSLGVYTWQYMRIPKILHFIWFGSDLSEEFKGYIDTWKHHHPDYEVMVWDEHNLPKLQNQTLFDKAKTHAERSDIARLEILRNYGGIYIDTDYECHKNIEPIIKEDTFFIIQAVEKWEKYGVTFLCNSFMGCTPNHPSINKLVDIFPEWYKTTRFNHLIERTGPGMVSINLHDEPIHVIPRDGFHGVYLTHHYKASWAVLEPARANEIWTGKPNKDYDKFYNKNRTLEVIPMEITRKQIEEKIKKCIVYDDPITAKNTYNNFKHQFGLRDYTILEEEARNPPEQKLRKSKKDKKNDKKEGDD